MKWTVFPTGLSHSSMICKVNAHKQWRTFPVLGWACNFPSAQQACRSFFRVIYVGGPLKGPQLTTTAGTPTPTRYSVLPLILFVNWNVFYKSEIRFCLIHSNNQWKIQKLFGVTTALGVNTELYTCLFSWYQLQLNIAKLYAFLLITEFCVFANPTFQRKCSRSHSVFSFVQLTTPYVWCNSVGCNSNLEKPHWPK